MLKSHKLLIEDPHYHPVNGSSIENCWTAVDSLADPGLLTDATFCVTGVSVGGYSNLLKIEKAHRPPMNLYS